MAFPATNTCVGVVDLQQGEDVDLPVSGEDEYAISQTVQQQYLCRELSHCHVVVSQPQVPGVDAYLILVVR